MKTIIISGAGGLVGGEAAKFWHEKGFNIVGIDNDMRAYFFGKDASTAKNVDEHKKNLQNYRHFQTDIRDVSLLVRIFKEYAGEISGVIHTAAQPSHDWAAKEPSTDFGVNANGTLNMLEMTRLYAFDVPFIFTSTNKVYGDTPNKLPLVELDTRWEVNKTHPYFENGIDESMSLDNSKHSIFGASKAAADIMVQEYGKYFGMKTGVFRGGCLTGPTHCGTELHGFLAYLVHCAVVKKEYSIFGYKGKQVRDNIHSHDLINAFWCFFNNPRQGEAYNMGGSRHSNISMLEAIQKIEYLLGYKMNYKQLDDARIGDHIWYVSDVGKFQRDYPMWKYEFNCDRILEEMVANECEKQGYSAPAIKTYSPIEVEKPENTDNPNFARPLPREQWVSKFPVILAGNDYYAPFIATTLYSILDNTESFVEFYILEDMITAKSKKKIAESLKLFRNYSIEYIDTAKYAIERFPNIDNRSAAAFSRYFIGDVLPDRKKVLYLDCDIIFCGDIAELYNLDLDNYPIAALWEDFVEYTNIKNNLYPEYKGGYFSFNSGVLLIDLEKFSCHTKTFVELTLRFQNLLKYSDQDVLNIVFDNNFKLLDYRYNFQIGNYWTFREKYPDKTGEIVKNPLLVHWSGMEMKPWKCNKPFYGFIFWEIAKKTVFYKRIREMQKHYSKKQIKTTGFYFLNRIPLVEKIKGEGVTSYKILGITIIKKQRTEFIFRDIYGYSDANWY
jgi:CDP-paratose 2-epimerase